MPIAAFLISMVGPLLSRILVSLGVSLVTIVGVVAAMAALKTTITSNISSLPVAGIQLLGLYGVWTAIGMLLGTWTFLITYKSTTGFMALAKV